MPELLTLQDLANGHLDVKALGEAANGDENTIVTTRTGNTYPSAERAINIMFQNGGLPATPFATKALMTASALVDGDYAIVANDPVSSNNGYYQNQGGTWVYAEYNPSANLVESVFSSPSKNLYDKNKVVANSKLSPSAKTIEYSDMYRRSAFIKIQGGETYTLTGGMAGVAWFAERDASSTAISYDATRTATAPIGANYAVFNITYQGGNDESKDSNIQFEQGDTATNIVPYEMKIDPSEIRGLSDVINNSVSRDDIFTAGSFNKINPNKINYTQRIDGASGAFVTDSIGIATSDYIAVIEGEWYTLSGALYGTVSNPFAFYYKQESDGTYQAVQKVTYVTPVSGSGLAFKVPTGLGITHVVVSLRKKDNLVASTTLNGVVQLELGELPTTYQPYVDSLVIKPELLPANSGSGSGGGSAKFDDATWYNYTHADGAKIFQDKLPKFRKAMLLKDSDVVVVNTGTSLTARTSEHSTLRTDAAFRPPMMHSNAFCSHIWDALKWEGQQYRRYDSEYFTETGTFITDSSLAEWDDGAYRDGLTRYSSSATASVSFVVPINAWQFNFIYRTDSLGCNAKISVAEGVDRLQVFNETNNTWVEAHNFAFSQLEATPVTRNVDIPSNVTTNVIPTVLSSKGNTTYQKRLKMRCRDDTGAFKSLDSVKNVTISRTGGGSRFMYWGVEWSPRQYMVTYINAARGSHNTSATGATGLPRFQDNEIWGFKPTLILSELGIHNDGAAAAGVYPVGTWAGLSHNYVANTDYELSMFSRAAHFGNTDVEYAFFTASIAWNFSGIEADGSLKYSLQTSSLKGKAKSMSALDKYQEASEYLNSIGIPCIDAAYRWVEAGNLIFGDLKSATIGSGKTGQTFTNEGSHWNDTGSKVMAKAVIPII